MNNQELQVAIRYNESIREGCIKHLFESKPSSSDLQCIVQHGNNAQKVKASKLLLEITDGNVADNFLQIIMYGTKKYVSIASKRLYGCVWEYKPITYAKPQTSRHYVDALIDFAPLKYKIMAVKLLDRRNMLTIQ